MRLALVLGTLLLAGCAGPHSSGALWAQQNLEREAALFRLSDEQRAQGAAAFELSLADEILASERSRIEAALQDCPGERRPLVLSSGDTVRDTVRLRAQADGARLTALAQIALADWRIRRGQATGEERFCDAARQVLSSPPAPAAASAATPAPPAARAPTSAPAAATAPAPAPAPASASGAVATPARVPASAPAARAADGPAPAAADGPAPAAATTPAAARAPASASAAAAASARVPTSAAPAGAAAGPAPGPALAAASAHAPIAGLLDSLGEATVSRDARQPGPTAGGDAEPLVQLSLYATQSVDAIRARAPLPQYLAAVYGGQLTLTIARPDLDGQSPEAVVDDLAPAYPEWEPDALYAALSSQ